MVSLLMLSSVLFMGGAGDILGLTLVSLYLFKVFKHDMDWFLGYGTMMVDSMSLALILLSVWVSILMVLSMAYDSGVLYKGGLKKVIIILMLFLVVAFGVVDLIGFYIFFEACLVPTLVLILGWGYQPERANAGIYMMLYTVVASLPLLCGLLYLDKGGVPSVLMGGISVSGLTGSVLFVFCLAAFMVKLPVYAVHLWLPKAHVEAPVGGSMILAGLLLKLGGYGAVRLIMVLGSLAPSCLIFMLSWAMFGGVAASLLCLRQVDVKCLIALSSVVHMGVVFGGAMLQSEWGYHSVILVMVGHGLCSSGLFCGANIIYKHTGSRSVSVVKGVQGVIPAMGLMWFLLCSSNMAAPPSLSLLGEMSGGIALVSWSGAFMGILFLMVFMSGAYSLYLYLSVSHGKGGNVMMNCKVKVGDSVLIMMHWLPLNVVFLVSLC